MISLPALYVLLAACTALWLLSLALADASIADLFWGPAFVLVTAVAFVGSGGATPRRLLALALVGVWGLRLAIYLAWRNLGHGEDYRYRAIRKRIGPRFWLISLGTVFVLQGLLAFVVSLPLQAIMLRPDRPLGALDVVGALAWLVGLGFETVGDWQLARFKRDPASQGQVMDRGLWRYTRHPNYFGDCVVWWGLYLLAAADGAWWTAIGPALMTLLLLRVSGVALLERTIRQRRPAYAEYAARTSAFVPWPPRAGGISRHEDDALTSAHTGK
jgi:steroid 5-alpha reductase family enzyme